MNRSVPALVLPLLLSTGCASVFSKPAFTCPEKGGARWTEVTSEHFVIRTDLDADDAQGVASSIETMFDSLSDLGFASEMKPRSRINVVYFRRDEEYKQVAPAMSSGYFVHGGLHDLERTPVALLYGDFVNRTRAVLQHELTHHFTHFYYPQAPVWLNEGLAEYYETLELDDGKATLGRPSDARSFWRGPWKHQSSPGYWRSYIPVTDVPDAAALMRMDRDEFYGERDADPYTEHGRQAAQGQIAHYGAAWALVHILLSDPSYSETFAAYLQRLHAGETAEAAWAGTLGTLPVDKLEADYRASLLARDVQLLRAPYAPRPHAGMAVRTLSDVEVHVLWAGLRSWDDAKSRAAADADLAEASAHAPYDPSVAVMTAEWSLDNGTYADGAPALVEALKKQPTDARLLNALGWLRLKEAGRRGKVHLGDVAAAVAPVASSLAPVATTAAELDLLARGSVVASLDASLAYEKRALDVDPSCYQCLSWAAEVLALKGQVHEALDTATLASALVPDGAHSPVLSGQIMTYRRRLRDAANAARARASSPPATAPQAAPASPPAPPPGAAKGNAPTSP